MKEVLEKSHGNRKITTEIFIQKAREIHGNEYSYSKSFYKNYHDKLIVTCPKHGDFSQSPYLHLRGSGCPLCHGNNKLTTEEFIQKAQKIHGNKYSYISSDYVNNRTKLTISCSKHGDFQQRPTRHLSGDGCPLCGNIITANKNKLTTKKFIRKAQEIHGNLYNYSKSNYIGWDIPVVIICSRHGEFKQKPIIHLNYCGCPDCGNKSRGEIIIKNFLEKNHINFERQKLFDGCKGIKRKLPFDFYLSDYNVIIEFDGIQHFKPVKRFGGINGFLAIQETDKIKNKYCTENSIILIRIKYNENIENKLNFLLMKDK